MVGDLKAYLPCSWKLSSLYVNYFCLFVCFYLTSVQSVQFSRSVVSDSLRPHESQHTRPLCPSPTPGVYPNSCPSSQWCHPTISSSVVPFSSCPESLPASGSFLMSPLFAWGGQSIGVSVQGNLESLLQHHSSKASILQHSAFFTVQLSHAYMTTGKTIALTRRNFVWKNHSFD